MQYDVFFFGAVPMETVGNRAPPPTQRRYAGPDFQGAYDNLLHWARTADHLGFDTMWLTEHHFQFEGYEVVPNTILAGTALALQTTRLRLGQMFNIVPQWHPLRLAEDFALAQRLTGGRLVFGVGRGTVPREAHVLGAVVASGDNDMSAALDQRNREQFEEAMEVIRLAFSEERFSFSGKHLVLPPPGIPDRGRTVTELTLVPAPPETVPIYQPVTTSETLTYAATVGHRAVFWHQHPDKLRTRWDQYAATAAEVGRSLAPGEDRVLVLNVHAARTTAAAIGQVRDAHDEFCRFLAPYGRFRSFFGDNGPTVPFDFQPTVEDSRSSGQMAIGSVDEVIDRIGTYRELLSLQHLVVFLDFPGLSREQIDEQMHVIAEDVLPQVR